MWMWLKCHWWGGRQLISLLPKSGLFWVKRWQPREEVRKGRRREIRTILLAFSISSVSSTWSVRFRFPLFSTPILAPSSIVPLPNTSSPFPSVIPLSFCFPFPLPSFNAARTGTTGTLNTTPIPPLLSFASTPTRIPLPKLAATLPLPLNFGLFLPFPIWPKLVLPILFNSFFCAGLPNMSGGFLGVGSSGRGKRRRDGGGGAGVIRATVNCNMRGERERDRAKMMISVVSGPSGGWLVWGERRNQWGERTAVA